MVLVLIHFFISFLSIYLVIFQFLSFLFLSNQFHLSNLKSELIFFLVGHYELKFVLLSQSLNFPIILLIFPDPLIIVIVDSYSLSNDKKEVEYLLLDDLVYLL